MLTSFTFLVCPAGRCSLLSLFWSAPRDVVDLVHLVSALGDVGANVHSQVGQRVIAPLGPWVKEKSNTLGR